MPRFGRNLWDDPDFVLGTILPKSPGTFDLGSTELPFRKIFLSEGSVVGDLTVGDDLIFSAATASIIPGATSLLIRNNADSVSNVSILNSGAITLAGPSLTFSATSAKIVAGPTALLFRDTTDANTNLTISNAGNITSRGGITSGGSVQVATSLVMAAAASTIIGGVTSVSFRNNADSQDNLLITDAGVVTARAAIRGTALQLANSETVAGAGTTQGTAAALSATATIHRITGANGTVGWILPATTVVGTTHILLNTTAGVALIYPATGGTMNGGSANAAFTALTGIKPIIAYATAADTWIIA